MARTDGVVSTLLVLALVGGIGVFVIQSSRHRAGQVTVATPVASRPGAPGPDGRGSEPPTVEESANREAFRVNEGLPADPALAMEFTEINTRYFDQRVRDVPVRWESRLSDMGGAIAAGFRLEGLTNGRMILLNPAFRDDEALRKRTLTHEMVHVLLWNQHAEHGPAFQRGLRDVATRAPYMGLVATDEEKEQLAAQLRDQAEALDREEKALMEERKALEAANPTAPGLQARIDAFNARVAQQHDTVGKYNGMVSVYNLMIAYPDGLDRERLATRRR